MNVWEYEHTGTGWILKKGDESQFLEIISRHESTGPDNTQIEIDTIMDQANQPASKVKKTFKEFTFDNVVQRLEIEEGLDPDGASLTTTTQYYYSGSDPAKSR